MNKKDLVSAISEKSGFTKKDSEIILNATLDTITEALATKEDISLTGFGKFSTRVQGAKPAREGVNPRKPEEKLQIPAQPEKVVPTFKFGKSVKEIVAGK